MTLKDIDTFLDKLRWAYCANTNEVEKDIMMKAATRLRVLRRLYLTPIQEDE